jgi:hypothetical protein
MEDAMPKESPFDELYHYLVDEVEPDTIRLGGSTPYTQLEDIVASYGAGWFSNGTAAQAARLTHRGPP